MHLQHLSLVYPLLLVQLPVTYAGLCIPKSSTSLGAGSTQTQTSEHGSMATSSGAETSATISSTTSESTTSTESLSSSGSTESTVESIIESTTSSEATVLETQSPTTDLAITITTTSTESLVDTPMTTTSEIQTTTACAASQQTEWTGLYFYRDLILYGSYVVPRSGSPAGYSVGTKWQNSISVTYKIDSATGRLSLTNGDGVTYWLGANPAASDGYYEMTFWPASAIESENLSYVQCVRCSAGPLACSVDGTSDSVNFIASDSNGAFYTSEELDIQGSDFIYLDAYASGTPSA